MKRLTLHPFLLAGLMAFWINPASADVALQGNVIAIENDGTLWIEAKKSYEKEYKKATEHVLQDYTRIHYNMLRFHVHGQEIGFNEPDEFSPHAQTQVYAIKQMKEKFLNKEAFIYCIELNKQRYMPSCITEIDKVDVADYLVKSGFAEATTTEITPKPYAEQLKRSESFARESNIGIWSSMQGLFGKSI